MLEDLLLPAILAGSVVLGAASGWLSASREMCLPRLYWNGMIPTQEWAAVVDHAARRECWLRAARYAVLAPVLVLLALTVTVG